MVYSIKITCTLNINAMEKAVRKLISSSLRLRGWTTLSNYKAIHTSLRNTVGTVRSSHIANIQKNFRQNCENIHARESIRMIKDLEQLIAAGINAENITCFDDIANICSKIERDIRFLEPSQIIRALRVLIYLNVPLDTKLNQTLLQLLRLSLNSLTVKQLSKLYSAIHNKQRLPLVQGLMNALPQALCNRVHIEFYYKSVRIALMLACNMKDIQIIRYILNIFYTNLETMDVHDAKVIFHALYIVPDLFSSDLQILSKVNNKLIVDQEMLNQKEVNFLLTLVSSKYKKEHGKTHLYNESLMYALCNNLVKNDIKLHSGLAILTKLNKMLFCDISLLDHLAVQCIASSQLSADFSMMEVYNFLKGLVIADYKTQFPKDIEKLLLDFFANLNCSITTLAPVVVYLLSLGYYCPDICEKVFTLYYCGYDDVRDVYTMRAVLRLHQTLQCLHPEYNGVTLGLDMVNKAIETIRPREVNKLYENMIEVFGDAKYIRMNLETRLGHIIDFTVVLRPDGSPVAISDYNNDVRFVEEIAFPPDCSKLLICVMPKNVYCTNLQNLISVWKLQLNVIKATTGANVLPINIHPLKNISHDMRNIYLRKLLKLKSKKELDCVKC